MQENLFGLWLDTTGGPYEWRIVLDTTAAFNSTTNFERRLQLLQ